VPNERIRQELNNKLQTIGIDPNSFAAVAQVAAYNHGEEWLEQLLAYLQDNLRFIEGFINERMPRVKLVKPEATYLAWLDFSDYGLTPQELQAVMREKAKVALDDGYIFGPGGEQFQRINFACPRAILEKALERIANSIDDVK
jgi:cystathionine beta-lyase